MRAKKLVHIIIGSSSFVLENIGIDETSYKKGHKYMTVVINHDTASVVWCAKGYGKEVLFQFFERLTPEQRATIRCASADGAKWIASCVEEYCPNAQRCRIPVFRELRKKIKRHFDAIAAAARFRLSNARSKAINNKIKLIIRTAFGFRNVDTFSLWLCSPAPIFIQSSSHSPEPLTRPLFLPKSPFFQYGSCIMQANRLY